MPPLGPLRSDDGPACRVCGCTEHNACVSPVPGVHRGRPPTIACSWVDLPAVDNDRPLCSACAGTVDDALEIIQRVNKTIAKGNTDHARRIGLAFIERNEGRKAGKFIP